MTLTPTQIKMMEDKAKRSGILCCFLCGKPSGMYQLSLKKLTQSGEGEKIRKVYVCNHCRPDLWEKR